MKKFKKISAIVLSSVMVFSAAACSKTDGGKMTEENKVAAASLKMDSVENLKCDTDMDFTMSADGETMDMVMTSEMYMFNEPLKMKMDMKTDLMGESMDMTYYIQKDDDGQISMYYGSDDIGWVKQTTDLSYVEELKGNAEYYLKYAENFESAGEEAVNGESAEKFTGVIKAEDINEVLENTNLKSMVSSTGGDLSDVQKIFEGLEDIPMTIWISNETGYPIKYEMDMVQLMQIVMDNTLASLSGLIEEEEMPKITVDKANLVMVYSDFNNVEDFEIPADVIENAADIGSFQN